MNQPPAPVAPRRPVKKATAPPRGTPRPGAPTKKKAVARVCCAAFSKLEPVQQRDRVWKIVHQLHHNTKTRRSNFTAATVARYADCTEAEATRVLTEAVTLKWFKTVPPAAPGQPTFYISPAKPK